MYNKQYPSRLLVFTDKPTMTDYRHEDRGPQLVSSTLRVMYTWLNLH